MSAPVILAALVAGAAGAVLRYLVTLGVGRRRARLPWAVLVVNVVGSGIGGAALALGQLGAIDEGLRLIVLGGFCGGLTTFSTLSVETVRLVLDGRRAAAVASVAANLALGVGAAAATWAAVLALG